MVTVSEQLRRQIIASNLTHYRIGTDAGVNIRTVDRFVAEGIQIKSFTIDKLCNYLGLQLTATAKARRKLAKKK